MTKAPNEPALLGGQVQYLIEQLNHIDNAVVDKQIDEQLRDKVGVRFQILVRQKRDRALRVLDGLSDDDASVSRGWLKLQELRADCAPLFAECLDFVEGALARSMGLDRGMCSVADALLEQLSALTDGKWNRFSILAEGEYFYDMAEIIRVRFPEVSVWGLPVAAHEFGHYLAGTFENGKVEDNVAPFRTARQQGAVEWAHLHEHFADAFATFALGPAYPCMCVLLRFDPAAAFDASDDHPSAAARVQLILDVLERMNPKHVAIKPYADVKLMLEDAWQTIVTSATGTPPELDDATEATVAAAGADVWKLLNRAVPTMRYQTWMQAQGLTGTLLEQHRNIAPLSAPTNDLRDVINAAWFARLTGTAAAAPALGDWAETTAKAIAAQHHQVGGQG